MYVHCCIVMGCHVFCVCQQKMGWGVIVLAGETPNRRETRQTRGTNEESGSVLIFYTPPGWCDITSHLACRGEGRAPGCYICFWRPGTLLFTIYTYAFDILEEVSHFCSLSLAGLFLFYRRTPFHILRVSYVACGAGGGGFTASYIHMCWMSTDR